MVPARAATVVGVGGTDVAVGVGGTAVAVGGTGVAVGGTGVGGGGNGVAVGVGGIGVAVGVGGTGVGVGGTGVGVGAIGNAGKVSAKPSWIPGPPRNNAVSIAWIPTSGIWGTRALGTMWKVMLRKRKRLSGGPTASNLYAPPSVVRGSDS